MAWPTSWGRGPIRAEPIAGRILRRHNLLPDVPTSLTEEGWCGHPDDPNSTNVLSHLYHSHSTCFAAGALSQPNLDDIKIFRESVIRLSKGDIVKIVTGIQACIDYCHMAPESASQRLKLLQDISTSSAVLPGQYWISRVTKGEKISNGAEATVYLGRHRAKAIVVREFHTLDQSGSREAEIENLKKAIIREIVAHWQLRHPNIVALLGIRQFGREPSPSMILQRAEHSSAIQYLGSHSDSRSFSKLLSGLFEGIHYLHTRVPPIIHGDLHDRNLVVTCDGDCLLCDFGLSRIRHEISRTHTTIHEGGRPRFLAPEIYYGESRINERSDIYSLAMTLYALGTRAKPFEHIDREATACRAAHEGERPQKVDSLGGFAKNKTELLWSLMESMWNHDPQLRPTVSTARGEMIRRGLMHSEQLLSRLIISLDMGPEESVVAVAYLTSGRDPIVSAVSRWPGQETCPEEAAVPTAVVYDEQGRLIACGAEAASLDITSQPAWTQPDYFMRHSGGNRLPRNGRRRDPKTIPLSRVYADYLTYLLKHTRSWLTDYFEYDVWLELEQRVEIVLPHPNHWSQREQGFLEEAAVQAGLIKRSGIVERLHLVEESDATAYYAMSSNAILESKLKEGAKFVICDARRSTTAISTYRVNIRTPHSVDFERIDPPCCLDIGDIHVERQLVMHLYEQLFLQEDFRETNMDYLHGIVEDGLKDFRRISKQKFSSPEDALLIRIGDQTMSYPRINITGGTMCIKSPTAETFFKPYVEQIIETVDGLLERHQIKIVILIGSFWEVPYSRLMFEKHVATEDKVIISAHHDHRSSTACAFGALKLIADGNRLTRRRRTSSVATWLTTFRKGVRGFFSTDR